MKRLLKSTSFLTRVALVMIAAASLVLLSGTLRHSHAASTTLTSQVGQPTFSAANFPHSTRITNPYSPLVPGTEYIYKGSESGLAIYNPVLVTHQTRKIIGVLTVVVLDTVYLGGQLSETTDDYYAQDARGNVWYFGENASQYMNGKVVGHQGSWLAGVNNAQPGIVMEAHPHVGNTYRQEFAAGVAQDTAQVLSITTSACAPYDCYPGNVLLTKEFSPLEPGVIEHKWYAPGVGVLKTETVTGGTEQIQLVAIEHHE